MLKSNKKISFNLLSKQRYITSGAANQTNKQKIKPAIHKNQENLEKIELKLINK